MQLTERELATILAALRYWQRTLQKDGQPPVTEHFTEATPLDEEEIDELCERLNLSAENRLAFASENPLRIKQFLRSGEFEPAAIATVQDLYEQAGNLLDRACRDICGYCLFEGEDGKFYLGTVEFLVDQVDPDFVKSTLEEFPEEDEEVGPD